MKSRPSTEGHSAVILNSWYDCSQPILMGRRRDGLVQGSLVLSQMSRKFRVHSRSGKRSRAVQLIDDVSWLGSMLKTKDTPHISTRTLFGVICRIVPRSPSLIPELLQRRVRSTEVLVFALRVGTNWPNDYSKVFSNADADLEFRVACDDVNVGRL